MKRNYSRGGYGVPTMQETLATIKEMKTDLAKTQRREKWARVSGLLAHAQRWMRQYQHEDPGGEKPDSLSLETARGCLASARAIVAELTEAGK